MNKLLPALIFFLFADSAYAGEHCKPSKVVLDNYEPSMFPNTNNLLRSPGEMPFVCGTKVIIKGKLVDKNCVPVPDAKINIWQKACDGKYPYKPLRNVKNKNLVNLKSASTFLGAGSTTTDNKGEFYFITTMPGTGIKENPYISIKVNHEFFNEFYTRLNLSKKDAEDPPVEFLTPTFREDGTLINEFKIVLPDKHPLRDF